MNTRIVVNQELYTAIQGMDSLFKGPAAVSVLMGDLATSILTPQGTGYYALGSKAVTRWKADPVSDRLGLLIYVRDIGTGRVWSMGYQPTAALPSSYEVVESPGKVLFVRTDQEMESRMEVCIAPVSDFEIRRCTLTNLGEAPRELELTSYAELVLQEAAADQSHPAFSKLFVETEYDPAGMLLANRRARQDSENPIHACHYLIADNSSHADDWETNRRHFIGRGNSLAHPAALRCSELTRDVGSVLDPIFSLRKRILVPAGGSVTVTYILGAAATRAELLERQHCLVSDEQVEEALLRADEAASERLAGLGIQGTDLKELNRVAFNRLFSLADHRRDSTGGRLPTDNGHSENGHAEIASLTARAGKLLDSRGIRPTRLVRSGLSFYSTQEFPEQPINGSVAGKATLGIQTAESDLQFANGIGGFSADGREYVIQLRADDQGRLAYPPLPWHNVVSNELIGFITSETGAGYTWAGNSRLNRITPWQNEPICDPAGEACYLRDRENNVFWSVTPGPIPGAAEYEVRHGWGYTSFLHESEGLQHQVQVFVPRAEAVKITQVRLTNRGSKSRKLDLFAYAQWDLSDGNFGSSSQVTTQLDRESSAVLATNTSREIFAERTAFAALVGEDLAGDTQLTADRSEFIGLHRDLSNPLALESSSPLSGRSGGDLDPCAAIQRSLEIAPGETVEFAFLLGEAVTEAAAYELIDKFGVFQNRSSALAEVKDYWVDLFSSVQIETPAKAIDLVVNGWLPYQNISCRLWGRSSSYQSGGAYGFRDQLQDSSALVHLDPEFTRAQILRNAAHQYVEGDVMHWWHPPHSAGIRTNFADDLLWMPLVACEYVLTTGDAAIWEEEIRFISSAPVPPGEPEIYLIPSDSGQKATLYEHCCRALERGLTRGNNGLPLMGSGDWNDGMNRIGQGGTGESVWMGFFIDYILERMIPVCGERSDTKRVDHFTAYRAQLRDALNDSGWDGKWYRRAYFDDGTPVGSTVSSECQIDGLVQAWAVMSGVAPPERAAQATTAAEERLIDRDAGLIRLLDPPFNKMKHDPGYIKGYLPGIRENGGQYTHGILWLIRAFAELGRGSLACELLEMISPVSHGCSPETVATYLAEPYVVAADVYSVPPHAGRAGWSWYTGSAGWFWRVAVESLLGIHLEQNEYLRIDPCIASEWPGFKVQYRLVDGKTTYDIHVQNPHGKGRGVTSVALDGKSLETIGTNGARIPLVFDGGQHQVDIEL